MILRRLFLTLSFTLISTTPLFAQGVQLPGALDWLFTDKALWTTPAAELPVKYKDAGYTAPAAAGGEPTLGTPRAMADRKSHLFLPELKVWSVTFATGTGVRSVKINFLPPTGSGTPLDRGEFRSTARRLEESLKTKFAAAGVAGTIDYVNEAPGVKWTCLRWTGPELQAVLTTVALDKGSTFTPQRLEVKLMPNVPPGKPGITKAPVARPDASGALVLEGMPAQTPWEGHNPLWLPLEQALHAVGRSSDRNTILDAVAGTGYPVSFAATIRRIITASGGKLQEITPFLHMNTEMTRVAKACEGAARKLGKPIPESTLHFNNIDPDVLRAARTSGSAATAFAGNVKTALTAGRPLYWYGWSNYLPENPREEGAAPNIVTRVIIGYAAKENEIIFSDAAGLPGVRMKVEDALAAAVWTLAVLSK
jgi:hypothetical protein